MTNPAQITRQAARDGVLAPTVERDYVLAHITHRMRPIANVAEADDRRVLTSRLAIRQMASPPAHRVAAGPNRGTHHARTHLHVDR